MNSNRGQKICHLPWNDFAISDKIFITHQRSFAQNAFNPVCHLEFQLSVTLMKKYYVNYIYKPHWGRWPKMPKIIFMKNIAIVFFFQFLYFFKRSISGLFGNFIPVYKTQCIKPHWGRWLNNPEKYFIWKHHKSQKIFMLSFKCLPLISLQIQFLDFLVILPSVRPNTEFWPSAEAEYSARKPKASAEVFGRTLQEIKFKFLAEF